MEFHGVGVRVAIPEKKVREVLGDVAGFVCSGRSQRRRCRLLLGKLSFVAGIAHTLRPHLRCLWKAVTAVTSDSPGLWSPFLVSLQVPLPLLW
eukprot:15472584-Alexandrium_andersonii.AAC.1